MKVKTIIRGKRLMVSSEDVEKVAKGLLPENIRKHYVIVNEYKFPPKQLFEGVLKMEGIKMERLFFTTKDASYLFTRLGFSSGTLDKRKRGIFALEKLKEVVAIGGDAVTDSERYYE